MFTRARPCLPARWPYWLVLGVAGVSCRGRVEQTIKDSEGRHFLAQCSADRICTLSPMAGADMKVSGDRKASRSTQETKFSTAGRLVGVCAPVNEGAAAVISDCRPVVCAGEVDCPRSEGLDHGVCVNDLCTEPSHPINTDDSVMLCLAGTGVGPRTPEQVERLALGLNCGTPCRIPKPCRQP